MWNDWCDDDDVLEVHRLRGGSGVQQRIQPRQTDNESSLLELVVVQDEGGDDKTPGSTGTERRKWVQSTSQQRIKLKVRLTSTHQPKVRLITESQTHQLIKK